MMKLFPTLYAVLCLLLLTPGCTSPQPIYSSVSKQDYNQRRQVRGAKFRMRITPVGVATTLATAAGGAYAANEANLVRLNNDEAGDQPNEIANYAIGGVLGFGFGTLLNYVIAGQGKLKKIEDVPGGLAKWQRKFDRNSTVLANNGYTVTLMQKSVEPNYTVRTYSDVRDFYTAFPESKYKSSVFHTGALQLERDELIPLIELDPANQYAIKAKLKYQYASPTLAALTAAISKFGQLDEGIEGHALGLIRTPDNGISYYKLFGDNEYKQQAFLSSFSAEVTPALNRDFTRYYGDLYYSNINEAAAFQSVNARRNYVRYGASKESFTDVGTLTRFYRRVQAIEFPEKVEDYAVAGWDIYDQEHPRDGEAMIKHLVRETTGEALRGTGLNSGTVLENYREKLEQVVADDAYFRTDYVSGAPSNYEFDAWKSSYFYDALNVEETGKRQFMVKGYLENRSKFAAPLKLSITGKLLKTETTEFLNINLGSGTSAVGSQVANFYTPILAAGEGRDVTVFFDFGDGTLREGYNLLIQTYSELSLQDPPEYEVTVLKKPASEADLKRQMRWAKMEDPSLSDAQVIDMFGGQYNSSDYTIDLSSGDYSGDYSSDTGTSSNCACTFAMTEKDANFIGPDDYYVVMQNEEKYKYSPNDNGTYEYFDNDDILFSTTYDTFQDMVERMEEDCKSVNGCY